MLGLQLGQCFIHALARQADEVSQLLLGDTQNFTHAGVKSRVEQRGQAAGHTHIGVVHAVDLARSNELPQALVELVHHKAVKADGMVQQPVKGIDRQTGHHAFA